MQIQRSAAVLLSQQPLRPCGTDPWVKQTRNALLWIKANSLVLRSSVGMQTWELITALASHEKIPLSLLIPAPTEEDYWQTRREVVKQFGLDEDSVSFRALVPDEGESYDKHRFMQERDRLVIGDADVVVPLSIRPKGQMSRLLGQAREAGKPIVGSWKVPYAPREVPLGFTINEGELTDEIKRCHDTYLVHWTRAFDGPWPTERAIDFYLALVRSNRYPRTGRDSLLNILGRRRITASSRNMPDDTPTVSFSALPPSELAPLIRWRARYRRMSFEPYGIGIERDSAFDLGVRRVKYYQRAHDRPNDVPPWLTQSNGVITDWRREKEYRCLGDLDFSALPPDKLVCFCRFQSEVEQIEKELGLRTVPFMS